MQKSIAFPNTNNDLTWKEIKEIPLTIASKGISRDKFNQGGERYVHWKLWNTDERNWRQK